MANSLVLDASLTFRLILPGPQQARCQALMVQWIQAGQMLYAPALWLYEITSALCKAVHLGELTAEEGERALALVQDLNLELIPPDETQARLAFAWTVRLNRAAAYDSFYLALAESLSGELWTADRRLHHAVDRPWVHYVGDS
ncbi:MAG: type II toxin-antitoxin system VapC family toxin [Chloroflexi bacterium]|nr:type II toxin-antitoxin system VapC family toxin [Chloroflexota bacterium]MBU1748832.1 type II toxin-antitoxin system VapC family toxin [Chloroflexota bacterium]